MNLTAAVAEIREAMERLEPEPEHTAHVAHLALRLFDELKPLHGLDDEARVILEGAACLHDIGWPVSKRGVGHHKHSARLIRQQVWKQLTPREVDLMAQVARYHRRALPCSEHTDFHALDKPRQAMVRSLAALLRLADAFDRSHLQFVRDLKVRIEPKVLEFTLFSRESPAREIAGAERKGNLAREVFGRDLAFRYRLASLP
ncbi:MAG: HD domain-containing protein [Verrucomicrobiales bacterium]|nr:HD domain-containing protein [Verrucomicrobiales bacterium]